MSSFEEDRPAPALETLTQRLASRPEPEKPCLALDPRTIGELYYRCARCMYRYVHRNAPTHVYPKTFLEAAEAIVDKIAVDGSFTIGEERVTLLDRRVTVVSQRILIGNSPSDVRFAGRVPALFRTLAGKTYVAWYEQYVESERRRTARDFIYQGFAYALAHPADPAVAPVEVDGIAIVIFKDVRITNAHGQIAVALRPVMLSLRERRDDHAQSTARVIGHILGARTSPPAPESCQICHPPVTEKGLD